MSLFTAAATASGTGSDGGSSTGSPLDLHSITAASQSKISTDTNNIIVFRIMTRLCIILWPDNW